MITPHAQTRMQGRGITRGHVDLLLTYGSVEHDHHGAEIYHFDKPALRRLERVWGRSFVSKLDGFHRAYAVVRDGHIVTTGHRYQRIRRH
jgi:hypothetical protein